MLTFSELPAYKLYELAPRVGDIQAHSDQQMAGLLMKAVADPIMWVSMAILFFRWSAMEKRADQARRRPGRRESALWLGLPRAYVSAARIGAVAERLKAAVC